MSSRKPAQPQQKSRVPLPILILGALLPLAILINITARRGEATPVHPTPRADKTAEWVVPAARYAAYPRVAAVYGKAAEIPHIVDGLYCYCECSKHSGHYSLLDCFHSDHGAGCDVCLTEVELAHRLHGEGKTLEEIRVAIDALYGS